MYEELPDPSWPELSALWHATITDCPPVGHMLRSAFRERWIRFHSLPGSKRYPHDESEYETVLSRYNVILDELFGGKDVYVVTASFSGPGELTDEAEPHTFNPDARQWTVLRGDDTGGSAEGLMHLRASKHQWRRGLLDRLLRAVADDRTYEVIIGDARFERLVHPYDGGIDCILESEDARDVLKERHTEWLSPVGL